MEMLSSPSPIHFRLSPKVAGLRQRLPYCNYPSSIVVSHAHPEPATRVPASNWTGPRGYGARHWLDEAPFSLWDSEKNDFRLPTAVEENWLITRYNATAIDFQFPIMVIETASPPKTLPLTVAAVAVSFVPPPSTLARDASGRRLEPLFDARPIGMPTNYAGPQKPVDPLSFKFRKWTQPSDEELRVLVEQLFTFCNPRMVHILCPRLIVELRVDDQRVYQPNSLPRRIGGFAVHYYHQADSVFEGLSVRGRERLISPTTSTEDDSDYLAAFNELCPGVRVESAKTTNIGQYADLSMRTTAGILVRDNHGHQRLTVSNHGFLHSDEVFHPTNNGRHIGEIDERFDYLDIALVKLNPAIKFTNATYFEAKRPRRLLRSQEIPDGVFFCVDGMSTGAVFMQAQGITLDIPPRPSSMTAIRFLKLRTFRGFGALGSVPREGICGAPFIEDDSDEGGVAGFFVNGNAHFALTSCLDEFIDRSWGVV
jgi:hypothetical protein